MAKKSNRIASFLSARRRWVQGLVGAGIYAAVSVLGISLWWVLAAGAAVGLVFGKVFCRWACPLGFFMELLTGIGGKDSKFQQMYQYHKLGCPIAWASGALNRFSLFRIRLDEKSCAECGACDKACYLSSIEPAKYSLYKKDAERPGEAFACSKCLACVSSCPSGSLGYRPGVR